MDWSKRPKQIVRILLLLFAMATNCFAFAQADSAAQSAPVWNDQQWEKAKEGVDYRDSSTKKKEEEKKEEEKPIDEDSNSDNDESDFNLGDLFLSPLGKVLCILLIIIILAATIALLMNNSGKMRDKKVELAQLSALDNIEELPEESDLERFLRLALEAGDYKTAVRILYLSSIQRMHEIRFIIWKKDKTNRDYLNEMRGRKAYTQFRDITLAYEIVWYGDTSINDKEYSRLQEVFAGYKNNLNGSEEK